MDRAEEPAPQRVTRCLDSWHRNFLAIVYKQSWSDGLLIDLKVLILPDLYASLQPLGNSGMATAMFLSIVDDKDKKGNTFSEK